MGVALPDLLADLAAETDDLLAVVRDLPASAWDRPTPAEGWTVRDQLAHLAFFDEAAALAATDPDRFCAEADALAGDGDGVAERAAVLARQRPAGDVLPWFETARGHYLAVFAGLDARASLPWFGPPMSAASSVTARLMETWAHGQDVVDALGLTRTPTARLRHVAHLGVRTLGWSHRVRGLPAPDAPVRVELAAPDGGRWTWGPEDAPDRVVGPAEGFCLLCTQRRHRDDVDLAAEGPVADGWLDVAQAFAGPPGPGRARRGRPGA